MNTQGVYFLIPNTSSSSKFKKNPSTIVSRLVFNLIWVFHCYETVHSRCSFPWGPCYSSSSSQVYSVLVLPFCSCELLLSSLLLSFFLLRGFFLHLFFSSFNSNAVMTFSCNWREYYHVITEATYTQLHSNTMLHNLFTFLVTGLRDKNTCETIWMYGTFTIQTIVCVLEAGEWHRLLLELHHIEAK